MKQFLKVFVIAFFIFLVISTMAQSLITTVANSYILDTGDFNVAFDSEMISIVDKDSPLADVFESRNRVNILMLGVNTGLTDTIMVCSFDPDAKHVDLISVPRDTYYHRPGYNTDAERKINAAYRKSPLNTAEAVSDVLQGMPIHAYIVFSYDGVANIVDAIGGVPMNIEFNMKYDDPYDKPPLHINIPKGEQVLDGVTSVKFLRYRSGYKEGDLGRVKAQQEFMKSAFRQALNSDLIKLAGVVKRNVDSDITIGMATKLAISAIGIDSESLATHTIPNVPQSEAPYYVYPQEKEIQEMLKEIYSIEVDPTLVNEDGEQIVIDLNSAEGQLLVESMSLMEIGHKYIYLGL